MKKFVAIFTMAFIAIAAYSQEKSASNAEMFINKPGVVFQREYLNISKLKNIAVVVEYITNLSTGQKISALDLECNIGLDNSETVSVLLDPDEVDGLLAFMQSIIDKISKSDVPKNYTEYSYITKSRLEAGCYWDKTWKTYVKIDSENSKTDVELNNDDLMGFISFVRQARSKM